MGYCVDERPKRGIWVLVLLLGAMWGFYGLAQWGILIHAPWAETLIGDGQLSVAEGIGSFDLIVLWLYIGIWEYRGNLREYMHAAFSSKRVARTFTKCPQCGFEGALPEESRAEQLLRERERTS